MAGDRHYRSRPGLGRFAEWLAPDRPADVGLAEKLAARLDAGMLERISLPRRITWFGPDSEQSSLAPRSAIGD